MKILYSLLFLILFASCAESISNKKVAIQPYTNFDENLIDTIKKTIEDVYELQVEVLQTKTIYKDAYVNIKVPRYRADSLIKFQRRDKSIEIDYVVGLTNKDISTTKRDIDGNPKEPINKYKDWGIFGLGYRPGPSCIISTYRLKTVDSKLFIARLKKVVLHELGHNFGLSHCTSETPCVMKDAAEKIATIDNAPYTICTHCKKLIK